MDSSNQASKFSSSSSSLPSSQSAWPPPHGPPRITGGENLFPPAKLEENHCRPMGVGGGSGVQVRADEPAGAVAHTVFRDRQEVCKPDCGRGQIYVGQEGHTMHSTGPNRRFLFPYLPCPQKRRKIQASCEPSSFEQMHQVQAFQNGGDSHSQGPLKEGRLHGQDRFKGCLFRHTNMLPASQVPAFLLEGPGLRVHMSPIWAGCSPSCLHKGDEASCGIHQEQGSAVCGIHRRFSAHASEETGSDRADSSDPELVGSSGIPGELFQVSSATISENRIPRIYGQLLDRGAQSPEGESGSDQIRGNSPDGPGPGLSKRARSADWQNVGSHSGSLPSPTSLQEPSGTQTQGASGNRIRWSHKSVSRGKGGSPLVGQQFETMEWSYNDRGQPTVVNRNRCILKGWGAFCQGEATGGCWSSEEQKLHINVLEMLAVFFALKAFLKAREGVSVLILSVNMSVVAHINKMGGEEISKASGGDKENVCLVFAETDQVASSTSPRKSEHHSRFPVQALERQNRLGPQCQHFQSHQSRLGSTTGGPICNSVFGSAKEIFQLEGGS